MGAGSDTTVYTARLLAPDLLERGRANALSCPMYQGANLIAVTQAGSSVSIYDASDTAQVNAAPVTVNASGVPTYSYTPSSSLSLGEGWRVEWTLIIGGTTHAPRNDAAIVRNRLYPVVTDQDLFRRVSGLDPSGPAPISTVDDYQDKRDEAWAAIQLKLIAKGNRPNLVMSPSSFREAHICLSLAHVFDDFATRLNAAYKSIAEDYRRQFRDAWKDLNFLYDSDDSGRADAKHRRRAATPGVWLCSRS